MNRKLANVRSHSANREIATDASSNKSTKNDKHPPIPTVPATVPTRSDEVWCRRVEQTRRSHLPKQQVPAFTFLLRVLPVDCMAANEEVAIFLGRKLAIGAIDRG